MSRKTKFAIGFGLIVFVGCALYAATTRSTRDTFSPVRKYVFRERTVCWESKTFGTKKIYLHGLHLKGITVQEANRLLKSRMLASGRSENSSNNKTWFMYSRPGPKPFPDLDYISLSDAKYVLSDGVIIGEMRPANEWDLWVSRLKNLRKKAILSESEINDIKAFFGE